MTLPVNNPSQGQQRKGVETYIKDGLIYARALAVGKPPVVTPLVLIDCNNREHMDNVLPHKSGRF
jgi:hypothetical protein